MPTLLNCLAKTNFLTFYDRMYTDLVEENYGDKTNNASRTRPVINYEIHLKKKRKKIILTITKGVLVGNTI